MSEVPNLPDPSGTPPWDVVVDPVSGEAYRPDEFLIEVGHLDRLTALIDPWIELVGLGAIALEPLGQHDFTPFEGLGVELPPNQVHIKITGETRVAVEEFQRALLAGEFTDSEGVIHAVHNTVFLADGCNCMKCPPHPAAFSAHAIGANPVWANPVWANPVWANPVWANPVWANPVWANPVWANGRTSSSALPANEAHLPRRPNPACQDGAAPSTVIILDTGLADVGAGDAPLLAAANVNTPDPFDVPDSNNDGALDPVAGHGTFIAGLVELGCPGAQMVLPRVVRFRGDTDVATFLDAALTEVGRLVDPNDVPGSLARLARAVLGMSFSGPMGRGERVRCWETLDFLRKFGVVIVASAGNEGTCERMFPASFGDLTDPWCLHNVVSVGALGRCGPAPFTNYGTWVRACAAGEMLTSSFFSYDEPLGAFRNFGGWAQWSGSSFSVGVVIGAFVREMRTTGSTAMTAVQRLVDAPGLASIPNLGSIVT